MTTQTEQLIESVVDEWMAARKPFTSLHVTNEVKRRGGLGRHTEMAELVHDAALQRSTLYDYTNARMPVGTRGITATMWYPTVIDPNEIAKVAGETIVALPPIGGVTPLKGTVNLGITPVAKSGNLWDRFLKLFGNG